MKRLVVALVTALLALPAAFAVAPTPPAAAALPPFSAIGDSTLLGMTSSAKAVLNSSYSMLYDARSCRRLVITSCRGRGVVPPNTLQTMRALNGRLGDAVVIMAGYDDWYNFGGAVDQIVAEARRQGVGRVIWLTYRSQGPYVGIGGAYFATYRQFNAILAAKVREHPELILADWDTYTLGKSSWFAADGIHISSSGATALAYFLKAQLDAQGLHRCYGGTSGLAVGRAHARADHPDGTRAVHGHQPATDRHAGRRWRRRGRTRGRGAPRRPPAGGPGQGARRDDRGDGQPHRGVGLRGRLRHRLPLWRTGAPGLEPQRRAGSDSGSVGHGDAQRPG